MNRSTVSAAAEGGEQSGARLYLLQGAPAVGKLTLARELEARTGAIVVDNHLVNNEIGRASCRERV